MKLKIDLKILLFIGVFYFCKQLKIYLVIMLFGLIHELAHVLVAKILKFKVSEFEIIPCGFCIKINPKIEDYNKKVCKSNMVEYKKVFISVSGPIISLIIAIIFLNFEIISYANLLIFLINLIPIYPLDGARLIKSVLKIYLGAKDANNFSNIISNAFMIVVTMVSSVLVLNLKNFAILVILVYLWILNYQENRRFKIRKKLFENIENMLKI